MTVACVHAMQSVRENSARALADAMRGYPHAEPLAAVHAALRCASLGSMGFFTVL